MPSFKRYALLLAASLGTFLASLDISIVNVALPSIQHALGSDMAGLQWVVSTYAICLSALMLCAGPLGDRLGHKLTWLSSNAVFGAGSLMCAAATDLTCLLIGRAIQGIAGAGLIPGALPLCLYGACARHRVLVGLQRTGTGRRPPAGWPDESCVRLAKNFLDQPADRAACTCNAAKILQKTIIFRKRHKASCRIPVGE